MFYMKIRYVYDVGPGKVVDINQLHQQFGHSRQALAAQTTLMGMGAEW